MSVSEQGLIRRRRKIIPPTLPRIVHRQSLVTELQQALEGTTSTSMGCKLVLLCAPAGYGKTTLLADFARQCSLTCCWYFLDHTDTDKTTFLRTLFESIRMHFSGFGNGLEQVLENAIAAETSNQASTAHYEAVIDALTYAMETEVTGRIALVLCNYHEIQINPFIHTLANRLLTTLPANCALIIESRTIPRFPLMTLMMQRQVFALGVSKLRFSKQDIQDLAQLQQVPLSKQEVQSLTDSFGGWIAGILLGTRLGQTQLLNFSQKSHTTQEPNVLEIDEYQQSLFEYVAQEVFQAEPEVYTFLKEASTLQYMTPSLCNQLLDRTDSAIHLHYLEQHGLFVTCQEHGPKQEASYAIHPIIGALFHVELRRHTPERFRELHRRAAALFLDLHEYEQAIFHAQEAGDVDLEADLIITVSSELLSLGQRETLVQWIDTLPPEVWNRHPQILLIRANLYLLLGEHLPVPPLLHRVETIIKEQPTFIHPDDVPAFLAELANLESKVLFLRGEYEQARSLSKKIFDYVPVNDVSLRAAAHLRLAVCTNLLGDLTTGIAEFQNALQLWGRNTANRETANIHSALMSAYSLSGNSTLAEYHLYQANRILNHINDPWCKVEHLIRVGLHLWREGKYVEAESVSQEALSLARDLHFLRGEGFALVMLGTIYDDQDRHRQALEVSEEGLAIALQVQEADLIHTALRGVAFAYLFSKDTQTALTFVARMEQLHPKGENEVLMELTRGTILLYQGKYERAWSCLNAVEKVLASTNNKIRHLQALLRVAACMSSLDQRERVVQAIMQITELLTHYSYEQCTHLELRRLPALMKEVQSLEEAAPLRSLLKIKEPDQLAGKYASRIAVVSPTHPGLADLPSMKIYALGEPVVLLNEKPVTRWRMARSMELFFLLLDKSKTPLRKEQLITALWSNVDEQTDHTWRSTLYYLRKVVGECCIIKQGNRYELELSALYGEQVWYDVAIFANLKTQAQQAASMGNNEKAYATFLKMIELYRGDYVQSFYNDWCTFRRAELRRDYLDARHQLAVLAWEQECFEEAATHWQHMLVIDNCLEEAHYGLMRSYLRRNKRSLALRQYQQCVHMLQNELGIAPGKAIQGLYQHMIRQK
ncbi:BTAD domain-containing putative transcriptional regulator [Dictyobacter kobayashii]|uniref:Bacterial transcriptional activator domain-containing protein n=1 Tax=Dictyobacter kobayashii TaxID=2014872 RepID=A0A402ASY0_9CHLR|nr:BTAD domain-containing putative transcriptional regulator [Dictyobacter kobayashii]GCE22207.1 hypothetical protein KDK_60070 [Dictyobacter kobayashii]